MNDITIGTIVNTLGIKGIVKVIPADQTGTNFYNGLVVQTDDGMHLTMCSVQKSGKFFHVGFEGLTDINQVLPYKGSTLRINEASLVVLEEDTYYHFQLEGMHVIQESGAEVGILKEVWTYSANDVYVVEDKQNNQILIPAVKAFILNIEDRKSVV